MNDGQHWYDADGKPRHTYINKKGGVSKTTIREAKKFNWYPSVTTILGALDKPQLKQWAHRQITDWCYASRPGEEQSADDYFAKAIEGAFQQVQDAADAGTLIHAALEAHGRGLDWDRNAQVYLPQLEHAFPVHVLVDPVLEFFKAEKVEGIAFEKVLVNQEHGFAGSADLIAYTKRGVAVIDFKTRKTSAKYKVEPYDGQPMQIAAYAKTHFRGINPVGCNVYISTTEPGRVEACWYDEEQVKAEYAAFGHLCAVWQHLKGYRPQAEVSA